MRRVLTLAVIFASLASDLVEGFTLSIPRINRGASSSLCMARKKKAKVKKLTYAERLQLHREKLAKEQGLSSPQSISSPTGKVEGYDEDTAQQRASKLVEAQRKSVDMLTYVKDRVDALPYTTILRALGDEGYAIVDDFLANDDVVSELQKEGEALYSNDKMQRDLGDLGTGEYCVTIQGGEDQYPLCPRTVEMVVSITKNMPPLLKDLDLSSSNCMASMRTTDRKTRMAASSLITEGRLPDRPFDVVINKEEIDARKVSLYYYPNLREWDGDGGMTIREGLTRVSSKRDRLVLLRSDTCVHRKEYFIGEKGRDMASCLELHLVS